jgi:hypothetical protein
MPDLNFYLNKSLNADEVAHSNVYGQVAGGGGAGGLSMEQRRKIMNQPRVVGEYRNSYIGRVTSHRKSSMSSPHRTPGSEKGDLHGEKPSNRQQGGIKDNGRIDGSSIERRSRFIEPTGRKYDKFG